MRRLLAQRGVLPPGGPGLTRAGWLAPVLLTLLAGVAIVAFQDGVAGGRILVLLLVAPIAEEALFRAGLHEALLRRAVAPLTANVVTALAFGLAHALQHGDPTALAVVLPALLIGSLYQRTRRVRHCVLLHAAMNALWLVGGVAGLPVAFAP